MVLHFTRAEAPVARVEARAYRVPADAVESDGTLEWDATTVVVVHATAADEVGIGWTYGHAAAGAVVDQLADEVRGKDAMDVRACFDAMVRSLRNAGRPGIGATAVSAVDAALWDLKAKLLGVPLVALLGGVRESVSSYGSGGFTSYTTEQLCEQLARWVDEGFDAVKMKVGREPSADADRVHAARDAVGAVAALYVDANGAYERKRALRFAEDVAGLGVVWFEEPVSSDDVAGLRLIRDRAPAGMRIAAGEYGWTPWELRRLVDEGAVDVLQADMTRCGGVTGFMTAAGLCEAACLPLSAHTCPTLHVHPCCAAEPVISVEYFHDHARVERMLFDGAPTPAGGRLAPDRSRPGFGVELREADAEQFLL